jgi:type I restriction enzyme S subunit
LGEYCGCAHLTEPSAWITDNALYVKEDKLKPNYRYLRNHLDYLDLNRYSNKMGQPLITQGIIGKVRFGLPTRAEQDGIADALDAVDQRIIIATKKRNTLQDLFRTLLHELMTGKVRVSIGETKNH